MKKLLKKINEIRKLMEFKKIINTAIKATQYTKKGINVVRKLPLKRLQLEQLH